MRVNAWVDTSYETLFCVKGTGERRYGCVLP